ncbi:hypothetical protein Slin14017_G130690 [Septoria linicola]|nr:hypothetical protein Slin14017_G130690 [Septoria linicola]
MDKRKRESPAECKRSFSVFNLFKRQKTETPGHALIGFDYESMPYAQTPQLEVPAIKDIPSGQRQHPMQAQASSSSNILRRSETSDHQGLQDPMLTDLPQDSTPSSEQILAETSLLPSSLARRPSAGKHSAFMRPFKNLGRMAYANLPDKQECDRGDVERSSLLRHQPGQLEVGPSSQQRQPSSQAIELLRDPEPVPQPPTMEERSNLAAYSRIQSGMQKRSLAMDNLLPSSERHIPGSWAQRRHGVLFRDVDSNVPFALPTAETFSPRLDLTVRPPCMQWASARHPPATQTDLLSDYSNVPATLTSSQSPLFAGQYKEEKSLRERQQSLLQNSYLGSTAPKHYADYRGGLPQSDQPRLVDFARNSGEIGLQQVPAGRQTAAYPPMWLAEDSRHQQGRPTNASSHGIYSQQYTGAGHTAPQYSYPDEEPATLAYAAARAGLHMLYTPSAPRSQPVQEGFRPYQLPAPLNGDGFASQESLIKYMSSAPTDSIKAPAPLPTTNNRGRTTSRARRELLLPAIEEEGEAAMVQAQYQGYLDQGQVPFSNTNDRTAREESAAETLMNLGSSDVYRTMQQGQRQPVAQASGYGIFNNEPATTATDPGHSNVFFTNSFSTNPFDGGQREVPQQPHFEVARTKPMVLLKDPVEIDWEGMEGGLYQLSGGSYLDDRGRSGVGYAGTPRVFR